MTLQLLADSASDLPLSFYEEYNVKLIPLQVQIEDREFMDLLTINPKQVYDEIRTGKMPTTSQASPQQLEEAFTELAKSGKRGLFIPMSSQLSGTYQTAVMIHDQVKEEYPSLDLTIIDAKCVSLGQGMVVKAAAEAIKNGEDADKIIQDSIFRAKHMEHIFTVEDLDFMARGGRLSKASAFLGGLLNIKPLLHVEDGKLVPIEKLRGRKKLLKRMIEVIGERGDNLENQEIGISHGDDLEFALEAKKMIEEQYGTKKFYINLIGSVVASHAGPGTLAIFFLNKTED